MSDTGKSGTGFQAAKYYLSAHIGICTFGSGLRLLSMYAGDKEFWRGNEVDPVDISINKTDLFGGEKKEGGLQGTVRWLPGKSDQSLPTRLAARLGLTTSTCPGYRGIGSLFFTGNEDTGGFYWAANNPYLKPVSVRVRRPPKGLDTDYDMIELPPDSTGRVAYAANPAGIIYECLTDPSWGAGIPEASINKPSFEDAAVTLFNEDFGLSMLWTRQSKIEDFVSEVLDHIQGCLFNDPTDGKLNLKLFRADYDVGDLPVINPDNARLTNFRRKLWGEISSEVVVTWTNPETEKEQTVSSHDPAARARQGGNRSASRNYYGVRSEELALRLAERDLAALVSPIAACDVELDRSWWALTPGTVVLLTWPEHGVLAVPMRVTEVNRGSGKSGMIRAAMQEDIFGLPTASYGTPTTSAWDNTAQLPTDLTTVMLQTAPAYMTAKVLKLSQPGDLEYPSSVATVLAVPNTQDDYGYELRGPKINATGVPVDRNLGNLPFPGTGQLAAALTPEASTVISGFSNYKGRRPKAGDFIVLGAAESTTEVLLVQSVSGNDYTCSRGMLDTIPRNWSSGDRLYVITDELVTSDKRERSVGETIEYRLLTQTSLGKLAYADATGHSITLTDRAHLPLRPANCKVDGVGFGTYTPGGGVTSFAVTWANRNRGLEAEQAFTWTDGTLALESGQTTTIEVLNDALSVLATYSGLTGTSQSVPRTDFGANTSGYIRFSSWIGSDKCLQTFRVRLAGL